MGRGNSRDGTKASRGVRCRSNTAAQVAPGELRVQRRRKARDGQRQIRKVRQEGGGEVLEAADDLFEGAAGVRDVDSSQGRHRGPWTLLLVGVDGRKGRHGAGL